MDIIIAIVGLGFILVGVFGAFIWPAREKRVRTVGSRRGSGTALFHAAFASTKRIREPKRETRPVSAQAIRVDTPAPVMNRPGESMIRELRAPSPGLYSEVDMLRAQVEELRSEIAALSSSGGNAGPRYDKPHMRRSGVGMYTHLPPLLRRQVREVRSIRRPMLRAS